MNCFSKNHGDEQGQHFLCVFVYFCISPGLVHRVDAQLLTALVRNWAVPGKRARNALWWPPRIGLQGAVPGAWGTQVGSSWPGIILSL